MAICKLDKNVTYGRSNPPTLYVTKEPGLVICTTALCFAGCQLVSPYHCIEHQYFTRCPQPKPPATFLFESLHKRPCRLCENSMYHGSAVCKVLAGLLFSAFGIPPLALFNKAPVPFRVTSQWAQLVFLTTAVLQYCIQTLFSVCILLVSSYHCTAESISIAPVDLYSLHYFTIYNGLHFTGQYQTEIRTTK